MSQCMSLPDGGEHIRPELSYENVAVLIHNDRLDLAIFYLSCPHCSHRWVAPLDLATALKLCDKGVKAKVRDEAPEWVIEIHELLSAQTLNAMAEEASQFLALQE